MADNRSKWVTDNYVKAYQLASQGLNNEEIAAGLGVAKCSLKAWMRKRPALRRAIEAGRDKMAENTGQKGINSFRDYIYQRLPSELQKLWNKINRFEKEKNGIQMIESILEGQGKYARMHLFLYALTASNFNISRACKRVNIKLSEFKQWMETEPGFLDMIQEIDFHKKNFFDEALVKKVREGDTSAVIFANKTMNRERYADKQVVEVQGKIEHSHTHMIDIDKLKLSLEVRKAILQAQREYVEQNKQSGFLEYKRNGNTFVPIQEG